MKRINVIYQGDAYSIADRAVDEVKAEIDRALESGRPHWMQVNHGEGLLRPTEILITAGVGIAIMGIDSPESVSGEVSVDSEFDHDVGQYAGDDVGEIRDWQI